jgi:integrase
LIVKRRTRGELWFGKWRTNGRQVMRLIGPKRIPGTRYGLTRPQAEAALRKLIGEVTAAPLPGQRTTIAEAGRRYLRHLEAAGRKPSTIAAVRGHLKHWHEPFFADRAIDAIRAEDITDLIALMRKGERPSGIRRAKPLSAKTIRNAIGTLNALLTYARRKRWMTTNPVAEVDLPGVTTATDIRFLTSGEVETLVAAVPDGPYHAVDRALYLTAAMTGLREGELIALRWRDVDWTAARVRVRRNYVLGAYGTPKSRRSVRSVPLADQVAGELDRLYKGVTGQGDDDLVFADPVTGGPLAKAALLKRYRVALRAARLDDTHRFHDLRHTFGTNTAAAGVPMTTLKEWMGHRDLMTTQRYADYAPSAREADWITAAFPSTNPSTNLSESQMTSEHLSPTNTGRYA